MREWENKKVMQEIFTGENAAWLEDACCSPGQWESCLDQVPESSVVGGRNQPHPLSGAALANQDKQHCVDRLVNAYRELGYLYASINPLGTYMTPNLRYAWFAQHGVSKELSLDKYGLEEKDLDMTFSAPLTFRTSQATLREIIDRLKKAYTGHVGAEFFHIRNRSIRRWLLDRLEGETRFQETGEEERRRRQRDLIRAEEFEGFIQSRFTGQKRFSLEGIEVLIPALRHLFAEAGKNGVKEIIMGMAHRGRLNVLANAMVKPAAEIFAMFQGHYSPHAYGGSGDVKYHMGQSVDYKWDKDKYLHISLVANPSHLEAVDPVVEGKARGTQQYRKDSARKKVIPILIHGDAAFSGQGIVAETFNMSQLRGYRTGGTIHIVVNNQIGFTTASADSRSTFFATDIAKAMNVPIFHVNSDNPDAIARMIALAFQWRHKFGQDVVVDIVGYRRLGHNEADEPAFTHPIMYALIQNRDSVSRIYGKRLNEEGVFHQEEQDAFRENYINRLTQAQKEAAQFTDFHGFQTMSGIWANVKRDYSFDFPKTRISKQLLKDVAGQLLEIPEDFQIHRKLERLLEGRRQAVESGQGIDWAFAESLAFGSLLKDGYSVRLSGEDCGRGTFSQRHAVWWDVSSKTPKQHTPLEKLAKSPVRFSVYDSPLSEFSVLGFEYGYSIASPSSLILWEAQFGDFANGAQVIIDQFVSAGESKWARHSGLVMLLPHAFEGQGPEHSNAYLERYLSLCAENNMQVANPSTPAQYFHVLRKQMHQTFRKPLILMTPKSLLRLPEARSGTAEFVSGSFKVILSDPEAPKNPETIVLCSGHVFYDLAAGRAQNPDSPAAKTMLLRIEQLYPFPEDALKKALSGIESAKRFVWAQEEPANRGAWSFIRPLLTIASGRDWEYAGRPVSASPATGSHEMHVQEREALIAKALGLQK